MTKQTFTISEGCKAVTVEQVGNQIITTFEPGFKRGDVLIAKSGDICIVNYIEHNKNIIEFVGVIDNKITSPKQAYFFGEIKDFRHATPEEAQLLLDALAREGKQWNPETMQVEEIKKERWRAEWYDKYFSISKDNFQVFRMQETHHYHDDFRFLSGNYFQTEEQAQRAAFCIKAAINKFWEEELK